MELTSARRWALLVRGINVGGHRRLPMPTARQALSEAGFSGVSSLLASGNLLVSSTHDHQQVRSIARSALEAAAGFDLDVVVVSGAALRQFVDQNPFEPQQDKLEHLFFLPTPVSEKQRRAVELLAVDHQGREQLQLEDLVCYLHTPDGFADSKLAAPLSRALPGATARNLRTARRLAELIEQSPA